MKKKENLKGTKPRKILEELISRSEYLVVQDNDLAKSFGNLKAFEHKILDYCFSFVQKDSLPSEKFVLETTILLKFLGLTSSGTNYKRVVDAFKTLNQGTALYLPIVKEDGTRGIRMTQLFSFIDYYETGRVEFQFSEFAQPYVFDLKKNYYSFHLRELANIKGKYALILMKLWEANRFGNSQTTLINGTLEEWQTWFLGEERRMTAGRFLHDVITRSAEELEAKFPIDIIFEQHKRGRKVIGYEMQIMERKDSSKPTLNYKENQASIYDYLD
ncbi:Rep [Streptococcus varani]|uniref:Rep n=1 Tax=Streptococcus varani TaxID=1608583 RepID=A0A0E4H5N4_9STRE|nr:replication initiation protein [Streptococcus varani]CQR26205.1 Rep [Streptococcus varani]